MKVAQTVDFKCAYHKTEKQDDNCVWDDICVAAVAVAAKLLQSCLTLCDPIDDSPPGSSVPGILQARILEWVAISFIQCRKVKSESEVAQSCPTFIDPMDCSLWGSSVHGISQARVLQWDAIVFSLWRVGATLQSFPPSGSFQMSQSVLCSKWLKYWSFSFNISPSNETILTLQMKKFGQR